MRRKREETPIWHIQIDGVEEGPYSISQLKRDRRITPDTLARKEGDARWRRMGAIPELADLFDDEEWEEEEKPEEPDRLTRITPDGLVIDMRGEPPPHIIWIALGGLVILYFLYRMRAG